MDVERIVFRRSFHRGAQRESSGASPNLAIPEKNGKTEYQVDAQNPEQIVTCVHSLFPHYGYSPCWYVKPRINQPIPM